MKAISKIKTLSLCFAWFVCLKLLGFVVVPMEPTHANELSNGVHKQVFEPARHSIEQGIRGITVGPIESSQHPGRGYGSSHSNELVVYLKKGGSNWVSLTPFARLWSLGSTQIDLKFEANVQAKVLAIEKMVQQAHAQKQRVLLIPHLWVETGGWRGEIDPGSDENWRAYVASYQRFVVFWAQVAERLNVDALSVGVECKSWSGKRRQDWVKIIQQIRSQFSGWLTYSANWDEVDNVIFWDLLDVIGVNAFYPLADHKGASDRQYALGAQHWVKPLKRIAQDFEKPVVFVEVGYTTRQNAAIEPWLWPDGMQNVELDEHEQARAMQALLQAFLPESFFSGFFLWRYYADLSDATQEARWGFSPHAKIAEATLFNIFKSDWQWDNRQSQHW